MTTTRVSQHYCEQLTDHPAHTVPYGPNALPLYHCPGRITCRSITSEKYGEPAHPMDLDPFAGTDAIWD
jgi:hypothetical protein